MAEDAQPFLSTGLPSDQKADTPLPELITRKFFQKTDWASFGLASSLAFIVYLITLSPDVTLDNAGIYTTGAMYAGVAHPPGFPVWTIFAWLFTKLLPFSTIAWRASVSSAFAAAMSCGLIALMVSKGGALILEGLRGHQKLEVKTEKSLRTVSSVVAGMAFALDGSFWSVAVRPSPWPLTILLFAMTTCLLMRWKYARAQNRYLNAAIFVYALSLTSSQSLAIASLGIIVLIALGKPDLGRDISGLIALLVVITLVPWAMKWQMAFDFVGLLHPESIWLMHCDVGIFMALLAIALIVKSRAFFSEWKSVACCGIFFLFGIAAVFYLPLASMTNPPMNWGYPRTVDGFYHLVSRGQYEDPHPADFISLPLIRIYLGIIENDFGLTYLVLSIVPFAFLYRMRRQEQKWLVGMFALFISLSVMMLLFVRPDEDRQSQELCKIFFAASHLILAIFAGYGMTLMAAKAANFRLNPNVVPSA